MARPEIRLSELDNQRISQLWKTLKPHLVFVYNSNPEDRRFRAVSPYELSDLSRLANDGKWGELVAVFSQFTTTVVGADCLLFGSEIISNNVQDVISIGNRHFLPLNPQEFKELNPLFEELNGIVASATNKV